MNRAKHQARVLVCVAALSALTLFQLGCGASSQHSLTAVEYSGKPLSKEALAQLLRKYYRTSGSAPEHAELQRELIAAFNARTPLVVHDHQYAAMVEHVRLYVEVLPQAAYDQAALPKSLKPLAHALWKQGSKMGDEGPALAALWLLSTLSEGDEKTKWLKQYNDLKQWGFQARKGRIESPGGYDELIDVWNVHAQLTPASSVMRTLTALYVDRPKIIKPYLNQQGSLASQPLLLDAFRTQLQALGQRAYDVVAVYLRAQVIEGAIKELRALKPREGYERRLLSVLNETLQGDTRADAYISLVQGYLELERSDVVWALCRRGAQDVPSDPRFALCLARITALRGDAEGAVEWYELAVRLAPKLRRLYDEAFSVIEQLVERQLAEPRAETLSTLAVYAHRILEQHRKEWPSELAPSGGEMVYFILGKAELNTGNLDRARMHLKNSLAMRATPEAMIELGSLEERTGQLDKALSWFDDALSLVKKQKQDDDKELHADIEEKIGDALRRAGRLPEAKKHYRIAFDRWQAFATNDDARRRAWVHLRQGVLEDRLGHDARAEGLLLMACSEVPESTEVYAQVLSHLVTAKPRPELALKVYRLAERQTTLDAQWKVYFALWLQLIYERAGVKLDDSVIAELRSLNGKDAWWSKLSEFATGKRSYQALLGAANGVGEQTEAHFYEAGRSLAISDKKSARSLLEKVVSLKMLGFYEYTMARDLLLLP